MTAATSWTSVTWKQKMAVGSDNPNTIGSDYLTKALGLSDAMEKRSDKGSDQSSESLFHTLENCLWDRIIRR